MFISRLLPRVLDLDMRLIGYGAKGTEKASQWVIEGTTAPPAGFGKPTIVYIRE